MNLHELVRSALEQKATDIHIDLRLPVMGRMNRALRKLAAPIDSSTTRSFAENLLNQDEWNTLEVRGSVDFTRVLSGIQCRINISTSDRGLGFAIRLLGSSNNTLLICNLHPSLADFLARELAHDVSGRLESPRTSLWTSERYQNWIEQKKDWVYPKLPDAQLAQKEAEPPFGVESPSFSRAQGSERSQSSARTSSASRIRADREGSSKSSNPKNSRSKSSLTRTESKLTENYVRTAAEHFARTAAVSSMHPKSLNLRRRPSGVDVEMTTGDSSSTRYDRVHLH